MDETKILYADGRPQTLTLKLAHLSISEPGGRTREHELDLDELRIGSADDNDIVVDDPTVSAYHCRLLRVQGKWVLRDEGSTNGTLVNGAPIREAYLVEGAVFSMGESRLQLSTSEESIEVSPSDASHFGGLVGRDRRMRELYSILERIAPTDTTVLVLGETGSGKEVVARSIHDESARRDGPFMVLDCSAVPENLVESELFGHEKGAFTGATRARAGVFELASRGTVFLDELGELPLSLQPKLLRVLETREIRRVGSNATIGVDVRLIAATNRDLQEDVAKGRFREDLYYRLAVVPVMLPSLRERIQDLPILVKHFLDNGRFNRSPEGHPRVVQVDRGALEVMGRYAWPGNVRELRNAIERAVQFTDGPVLSAEALPDHVKNPGAAASVAATSPKPGGAAAPAVQPGQAPQIHVEIGGAYREAKERVIAAFEESYVTWLLERHHHNVSAAARDADMDRKHLRRLMKKLEADTQIDDD